MGAKVTQLYRKINDTFAYCFNVESSAVLTDEEDHKLRLILAEGFLLKSVSSHLPLEAERIVEIGPRLNFATAWSANMVSICQAVGLDAITRVERTRCYVVPEGDELQQFIDSHHDRMTECVYPETITSFAAGIEPEAVYEIDLKGKGPDGLQEIPGISMDEWDRNFYYEYFVNKHDRNPTIVEIMDLNNANSEHSRHGFFRGRQIIDGVEQETSLFNQVMETLEANPRGSVIAFKDNSSALQGHTITTLHPQKPGEPSLLGEVSVTCHPLLTAETHNFPTGVAPFPGAETGTGGRIRDVQGTGQGGFVMAGTAGYCVAGLHIPGYELPWEKPLPCPGNLASALEIEIEASNGASDYGNKFGEPLVQGFTRSFDMRLENGERWGFLKPVMFTGGIGQIDDRHTTKKKEEKGMLIVQAGGPAYRVGFGGGAASSMLQGENVSDLDFDAVQRGDAEMEQKLNRVIRACNEMGNRTLVDVIHDQGAGGPANVLKELVEHSGGRVEIRNIRVGDPTMSVLEIYVAEYQERCGFLIRPENIEQFQRICAREKVACEVLGEVTGNLRFVVHDAQNNTTPVDIEINELLGNIPQKEFADSRLRQEFKPLEIPETMTVREALYEVLRLVSVGSKRFLTNKVDRAVTGLVARQQCCGPLQLTVADVAVIAQSHFGCTGIATAIGEQPVKMLIDPAAGARMAVGEALTNLVWAKIDDPEQIKCSANWMWAPKLPGEGAALCDAVTAMCEAMKAVGIAADGGKDSLSMATMVDDEIVKSPRELVISAYAAMGDIRKVITPDIKQHGSTLALLDLSGNRSRMGGSALAQVLGRLGNDAPDMDHPVLVKRGVHVIQQAIENNLILAGHDRSDGGLVTTMLEMAFAGNCGFDVEISEEHPFMAALFAEELGLVVECHPDTLQALQQLCDNHSVPLTILGTTIPEKTITISCGGNEVLREDMRLLRQWWEETSYQLETLQADQACVEEERKNSYDRKGPTYHLPFKPQATDRALLKKQQKPKVAILRDEGSNSDREMSSAFYAAGFEPWDICMNDLLTDRISLEPFRGLAAVGGFSYADVPESAKGWAATIRFNEKMARQFQQFYERPDTFTLGICNGCQLFGLLGWVPWQGLEAEQQPRFIRNRSGRFESRWATIKVQPSRAMMFKKMEGLIFGIHVDHGEGRLYFPETATKKQCLEEKLCPVVYVDDNGQATESYPCNPNGSPGGIAGLCSADGRHLAMMPHPERVFLPWQAHWLPQDMADIEVSPWLKMFQNAYAWCML
ncbi:MAG: phosphoribosylformylglycinamidine synthase [Deltaproteobacteria bacterium]|nr:MAG: phosphoribosylformylglycinamidine synthase [Deltaproteobacteria bacterium]